MSRLKQRALFQRIQKRPEKRRPHIVRWTVDGKPFQESHATQVLARRYLRRLETAFDDGERFDPHSGRPQSWAPQDADTPVYDWARRWLAHQWGEIAPRTRKSYAEAMARFVALAVHEAAPEPPKGLWEHLDKALRPGADIDDNDPRERWVCKWGLTLGDLDKDVLAEVDRKLGLKANGKPRAAVTANRYRTNAKACVRWAVQLEKIPADPWPDQPRGRKRRKANRVVKAVDIRRLPAPEPMAEVLEAFTAKRNTRRARRWRAMSAVAYYAGPRPSEVTYLRRSAVHLPHRPAGGWCLLAIEEVDDGEGEGADPKTGYRLVPGQPVLTEILWTWVTECEPEPDDFMFLNEAGDLPRLDHWNWALKAACKQVGVPALTPYDLRHACATTMLRVGVALGEAARRLGHSVQTLVTHYIQALTGDEQTANERIEEAFSAQPVPRRSREQ